MGNHSEIEHRVGHTAKNRGKSGQGYRVLLADDDYEMRRLLAWSLNKEGYHVTECKDGNALIKKVGFLVPHTNTQAFDLIISDIRMPGSTGLQVLESANDFEELPPILLITAFPDDEIRKKARQLGAVAFVEKPFDVDALMDEVHRILPRRPAGTGKRPSPDRALQHSIPLPFPVNITFRHTKGVEAICAFIRDTATKLNSFADHIRQVHVVVEDLSPEAYRMHRHHIGIRVVIGDDKPVVVSHRTDHSDSHENLYLGIRIAFGMARRQLKHRLGRHQAKRFTRRGPSQQELVDEYE